MGFDALSFWMGVGCGAIGFALAAVLLVWLFNSVAGVVDMDEEKEYPL